MFTSNSREWQPVGDGWRGEAGGGTNLFRSPVSGRVDTNAPMLLDTMAGDFIFSAQVTAGLRDVFDAAALVLFEDDQNWAKLCLEFSPALRPMIVSVVTREVSDDCNHVELTDASVYLRIARMGGACAFHYSTDGAEPWQLVRVFAISENARVGLAVQSPRGSGCTATFTDMKYEARRLRDIRSGN